MKIGIDLLWVRPGICGGTESYIRNLLHGFGRYDSKNEYILFTARDNADSFGEYKEYTNMKLEVCPTICASQARRLLWENLHLDRAAKKQGVDVMFIPVYSKPRTYGSGIPYVCVIHDLQALHYPEYFSFFRRCFLKYSWKRTCKSAEKVVTISNYCKDDLIKNYPFVKEKALTIYNPIVSEAADVDFVALEEGYAIRRGEYFYCVSSLLPHKNIDTVLKVMGEWQGTEKLVLSGVGQNNQELREKLQKFGVEDRVVPTGFVSDAERDSLYENCRLFLFPSVFEGFGMPPIEAMRKGKRVVMTPKTCLWEVTKGKAIYIQNPYSIQEWMDKMQYALNLPEEKEEFPEYRLQNVTEKYMELWSAAKGR